MSSKWSSTSLTSASAPTPLRAATLCSASGGTATALRGGEGGREHWACFFVAQPLPGHAPIRLLWSAPGALVAVTDEELHHTGMGQASVVPLSPRSARDLAPATPPAAGPSHGPPAPAHPPAMTQSAVQCVSTWANLERCRPSASASCAPGGRCTPGVLPPRRPPPAAPRWAALCPWPGRWRGSTPPPAAPTPARAPPPTGSKGWELRAYGVSMQTEPGAQTSSTGPRAANKRPLCRAHQGEGDVIHGRQPQVAVEQGHRGGDVRHGAAGVAALGSRQRRAQEHAVDGAGGVRRSMQGGARVGVCCQRHPGRHFGEGRVLCDDRPASEPECSPYGGA